MQTIEFQFHITFDNFSTDKKQDFINLCERENVKPVMIVLPKGDYVNQPMFTKLVSQETFAAADNEVQKQLTYLPRRGTSL